MTAFGLVRPAVGDDQSARSKYYGPTGKPRAGKLACAVWSGGKAVRPYLSLLKSSHSARSRRLNATVGRRSITARCPFVLVQGMVQYHRIEELQAARFNGGGYERTVSNDHYS